MKTHGEDLAFQTLGNQYQEHHQGMTKREHFAALALQGLCAKGPSDPVSTPIKAVKLADGLIAALNQ